MRVRRRSDSETPHDRMHAKVDGFVAGKLLHDLNDELFVRRQRQRLFQGDDELAVFVADSDDVEIFHLRLSFNG